MLDFRFFRESLLYAVSLLRVQGTIYLLQFVAAAKMPPADYSVVRIIESLVAIGAQLATFGQPSIALVRIGIARSDEQRRKLIRRALLEVPAMDGGVTQTQRPPTNRRGSRSPPAIVSRYFSNTLDAPIALSGIDHWSPLILR